MQIRKLAPWLFPDDYEFWIKYVTNGNAGI